MPPARDSSEDTHGFSPAWPLSRKVANDSRKQSLLDALEVSSKKTLTQTPDEQSKLPCVNVGARTRYTLRGRCFRRSSRLSSS